MVFVNLYKSFGGMGFAETELCQRKSYTCVLGNDNDNIQIHITSLAASIPLLLASWDTTRSLIYPSGLGETSTTLVLIAEAESPEVRSGVAGSELYEGARVGLSPVSRARNPGGSTASPAIKDTD